MRRALTLALTLAAGCYPAIPGTWDDYYVPKKAQILGVSSHISYVGGYWGEGATDGAEAWWGWLEEPEAGWSGLDILEAKSGRCTPERESWSDLLAQFAPLGPDMSEISGPSDYYLPWHGSWGIYYTELDQMNSGSYDLVPLDTDEEGTLKATGLFEHPDPPELEGPELDGNEIASVSLDELVFSWDPEDEAADYVLVNLMPARVEEDSYLIFESLLCVAPYGAGELAIDEDELSDPGDTQGLYVARALVNDTAARIGTREQSAVTASMTQELGFLVVEGR